MSRPSGRRSRAEGLRELVITDRLNALSLRNPWSPSQGGAKATTRPSLILFVRAVDSSTIPALGMFNIHYAKYKLTKNDHQFDETTRTVRYIRSEAASTPEPRLRDKSRAVYAIHSGNRVRSCNSTYPDTAPLVLGRLVFEPLLSEENSTTSLHTPPFTATHKSASYVFYDFMTYTTLHRNTASCVRTTVRRLENECRYVCV